MAAQVQLNNAAVQRVSGDGRLWTRRAFAQVGSWTRGRCPHHGRLRGRAWTSMRGGGEYAGQVMDATDGRRWTRPGPVGWTPRLPLGGVHPSVAEDKITGLRGNQMQHSTSKERDSA